MRKWAGGFEKFAAESFAEEVGKDVVAANTKDDGDDDFEVEILDEISAGDEKKEFNEREWDDKNAVPEGFWGGFFWVFWETIVETEKFNCGDERKNGIEDFEGDTVEGEEENCGEDKESDRAPKPNFKIFIHGFIIALLW